MKKTSVLIVLLIFSLKGYAQLEIGLKFGLNTTSISNQAIVYNNDEQHLEIDLTEVEYGYQLGIYSRLSVASFYLEPIAVFNSSRINYQITEFTEGEIINSIKSESFRSLDIPVLFGIKMGFFRIQTGPVAHINIDSKSELIDIDGYEQKFKEATYGFQIGAGLDIWKLRMDLNYEGNFSRFADHLSINGTDLAFDDAASRILFTLGYKF